MIDLTAIVRTDLRAPDPLRWLLASAAALAPCTAHAQVADNNVGVGFNPYAGRGASFELRREPTVLERRHPEYEPIPKLLGTFEISGKIEDRLTYDSSIFASNAAAEGDLINALSGSLQAQSRWSRNELRAFVRGDMIDFKDHTDQSRDLFAMGGSGRIDIGSLANIQLGSQFGRNVLSRFSTRSTSFSRDQIVYHQLDMFAGLAVGARDLHISGNVLYDSQHFIRRQGVTGTPVEQFDDAHSLMGQVQADYSISASLLLFARGTITQRSYSSAPVGLPLRDSVASEFVIGARAEISPLLRGEFSAGRIRQNFDAAIYRDLDEFAYHGSLTWLPARRLTVEARADRSIADSYIIGSGAFIGNSYSIGADYEFLRNFILSAQAEYGADSFRGIDLHYERRSALVSGRYSFNRKLALEGGYELRTRDVTGSFPAPAFDSHRGWLALSYRF